MSIEIPNVAHAMGVALATGTALAPVLELVSGQGFESVDPQPALNPAVQFWELSAPVNSAQAICFGGSQTLAVAQLAIVGPPPSEINPALGAGELLSDRVVTQIITPVLGESIRGTIWCAVYLIPGEVSA